VDLADDPHRRAGVGRRQRCALPGESGSYDENIVLGHLEERRGDSMRQP
jgi:hypothetical protein